MNLVRLKILITLIRYNMENGTKIKSLSINISTKALIVNRLRGKRYS